MDVDAEMSICIAEPADFPAVRALVVEGLAQRWQQYDSSLNPDLESFESFYDSARVVVAKIAGEVVGCGALLHEGAGVARIVRMSVKIEHQSKGIGSAVLRKLLELAANTGYREVVLETTATWRSAIAFYVCNGFAPTVVKDLDQHFRLSLVDA